MDKIAIIKSHVKLIQEAINEINEVIDKQAEPEINPCPACNEKMRLMTKISGSKYLQCSSKCCIVSTSAYIDETILIKRWNESTE